jgi:hypothetical protein
MDLPDRTSVNMRLLKSRLVLAAYGLALLTPAWPTAAACFEVQLVR